MRWTGRLQFSDSSEEVKHPIILPKAHALSRLLAANAHRRTLHGGVQVTPTTLRDKIWIPQARQLVKSVIHSCSTCVRFRASPATATTAPLPADRVSATHPFKSTGVDFAGQVYVKRSRDSYQTSKYFIALFTCATTRAIHLELVTDLTARAFILAFRRFASRRGTPSVMYSDNALTFKKAAKDL
ncbi:uncharacterized protein LOC135372757 [Ornithodoros turicata]|uniref:uncharacterized protein LOC135372757 n=1 Tax=Ornithodoros turicata TaxID=34597 RepID=UPI0031397B23